MLESETCFGCAKAFAADEPSIVIDDREFCVDCAEIEAAEMGSDKARDD